MKAKLIPFRCYRFCVPQSLVMNVLQLVVDYEIRHSLYGVSKDEQYLSLGLSINLNKRYQRKAIKEIEKLLLVE